MIIKRDNIARKTVIISIKTFHRQEKSGWMSSIAALYDRFTRCGLLARKRSGPEKYLNVALIFVGGGYIV
ncbi:MAG: hypothetical protein ABSG06_00840 [Methanoregula sp.]|jgi:hypothetical protein